VLLALAICRRARLHLTLCHLELAQDHFLRSLAAGNWHSYPN
jgi:hypothetical protein